jgi:hypothetical protein
VLAFRDSKHTNVKQQVMLLIPKMSEFAPEKFVLSYLEPCTAHLLSVLVNKSHANSIAFQALGQMLVPLAGPTSCRELQRRLQCRLPDIEKEILDALAVKGSREQAKRSMCIEAITCIGIMAEVRRSAAGAFMPPCVSSGTLIHARGQQNGMHGKVACFSRD